jgi:hypothetical protein
VGVWQACFYDPWILGKEGNTVHKVLGVLFLCLAFMIGVSSVGCNKKATSGTSGSTGTGSAKPSPEPKGTGGAVTPTPSPKAESPEKAPPKAADKAAPAPKKDGDKSK